MVVEGEWYAHPEKGLVRVDDVSGGQVSYSVWYRTSNLRENALKYKASDTDTEVYFDSVCEKAGSLKPSDVTKMAFMEGDEYRQIARRVVNYVAKKKNTDEIDIYATVRTKLDAKI